MKRFLIGTMAAGFVAMAGASFAEANPIVKRNLQIGIPVAPRVNIGGLPAAQARPSLPTPKPASTPKISPQAHAHAHISNHSNQHHAQGHQVKGNTHAHGNKHEAKATHQPAQGKHDQKHGAAASPKPPKTTQGRADDMLQGKPKQRYNEIRDRFNEWGDHLSPPGFATTPGTPNLEQALADLLGSGSGDFGGAWPDASPGHDALELWRMQMVDAILEQSKRNLLRTINLEGTYPFLGSSLDRMRGLRDRAADMAHNYFAAY